MVPAANDSRPSASHRLQGPGVDLAAGGDYLPTPDIRDSLTETDSGAFLLTRDDGTQYWFEDGTHQHITRMVDINGNTLTFAYEDGKLTSVNDGRGRTFDLSYADTHLTDVSMEGVTQSFQLAYDANDDLVNVSDVGADITRYEYQGHLLTRVVNPRGYAARVTYENNAVTSVASELNQIDFAYDDAAHTTSISQMVGGVLQSTRHIYDSTGAISQTIDPLGNTTNFAWDARGNLTRLEDAAGGVTSYTYDQRNNLLTETDPEGGTTTYTYDPHDRIASKSDALGNTIAYTYDERGNRIAELDALGNTVSYAYDSLGNILTDTDGKGSTTSYTYDAFGYPVTQTDALGNISQYVYNVLGYLLKITDPTGGSTDYTFDERGLYVGSNELGGTSVTTYDANNNRVSVEAGDFGMIYVYDALDRLVQVSDANSRVTHYTYDEAGNLLTIADANGGVTSFSYDAANRRIGKTDALGNVTSWTYDALGNVISQTAANGAITTYTYDATSNLLAVAYPDGTSTQFTYNAAGWRTQMQDASGTTAYEYDALGHLTGSTDGAGNTVSYEYDAVGNLTALIYPDDSRVTYTYDANNLPISVVDDSGTTSYAFNGAGQLIQRVLPNGITTDYRYNLFNRLTGLTHHAPDGAVLMDFSYTINNSGMRTALDQTNPDGSLDHYDYTYDKMSQIIGVTLPGGDSLTYTYDALGNRTSLESSAGKVEYTYNALNELTAVTEPDGSQTTYQYDPLGNLQQRDNAVGSTRYTFDGANRLINITDESQTSSYIYNGDGVRVAKVVDGVRTDYVMNATASEPDILAEQDDTGMLRSFTLGTTRLAERGATGARFYLEDGLGSIMAATDEGGDLTEAYSYTTFGQPIDGLETTANYRYAGAQFDQESGLIFMRARYYDPAVGRFISQDPYYGLLIQPTMFNGYSYVENNPINNTDPRGEFLGICELVVAVVIAVAVSVVVEATIEGIVEVANGGNFWDGAARGAISALTDPLSYIPLGGFSALKAGYAAGKAAAKAGLKAVARAGFTAAAKTYAAGATRKIASWATKQGAKTIALGAGMKVATNFANRDWNNRLESCVPLDPACGFGGWAREQVSNLYRGQFYRGQDGLVYSYAGGGVAAAGTAGGFDANGNPLAGGGYDADGNLVADWGGGGSNVTAYGDADSPLAQGMGPNGDGRCIAMVESQVDIGVPVIVKENNEIPLALRVDPSTLSDRVSFLDPGTLADITGGPHCGLGNGLYIWWQIQTVDGQEGYVAEGDAFRQPAVYFIEPAAASDPIAFDPLNCRASVPSLVEVGDRAVVNAATNAPLRVRDNPGGEVFMELEPEDTFTVSAGPECAEGGNFKWWQITTNDGTRGWVAEGDGFQTDALYFIVPEPLQGIESGRIPFDYGCPASPLSILKLGDVVEVAENGEQLLNFRSTAGGESLDQFGEGTRMEIVGGPTCADQFHWWQVRLADDRVGWIAEGDAFQRIRYFIRLAQPDDTVDDLGFDPQTSRCGTAPDPHMVGGDTAFVTENVPDEALPLRSSPYDKYNVQLGELKPNAFIIVADGLICGDEGQQSYWLVRDAEGNFGWVSEGITTQPDAPYFIEPFGH